jgi:hypothetical protein
MQLGDSELHGVPRQTKVTFTGNAPDGRYERYHVYHEYLRRTPGRTYMGEDFESFYEKNEFEAFVHREKNLLVCQFAKRIARDFVDRLNESRSSQFNVDYLRLDFNAIKPHLREIRGIWFTRMEQPFLDAAGLFGPSVDKSDFYKQAEAIGNASSFLICHACGETIFPLILSANYGISFLRPEAEGVYFELIDHLQSGLLAGAVVVEDSRFNARRKKREEREARKGQLKPTPKDTPSEAPLFEAKEDAAS